MPGAVIVGAGPGIGAAVARRFAAAGLPVGLIARSAASLDATRATLTGAGAQVVTATADAARENELAAALDTVTGRLGVPDALIYNAGLIQRDRPGELGYQRHLAAYAVNVLGALATAARVAPAMAAAGGGTILITGGMPVPDPAYTSLSLGKAGVRALTSLLASEYGPSGVHVATVTVAGAVAAGGAFDPDRIAEYYWRLHRQPRDAWQQEAVVTGGPATGPRDVLARYLDALTAGDLAAIARSFAEDATWHLHGTLPLSGTKRGRDAIMAFLTSAGPLYRPGTQQFTFGEITAEGDRAVLEWRVRGTASATGRAYDNSYCAVFRVRDGQITEVREYLDSLHAAQVLFGSAG